MDEFEAISVSFRGSKMALEHSLRVRENNDEERLAMVKERLEQSCAHFYMLLMRSWMRRIISAFFNRISVLL